MTLLNKTWWLIGPEHTKKVPTESLAEVVTMRANEIRAWADKCEEEAEKARANAATHTEWADKAKAEADYWERAAEAAALLDVELGAERKVDDDGDG